MKRLAVLAFGGVCWVVGHVQGQMTARRDVVDSDPDGGRWTDQELLGASRTAFERGRRDAEFRNITISGNTDSTTSGHGIHVTGWRNGS